MEEELAFLDRNDLLELVPNSESEDSALCK